MANDGDYILVKIKRRIAYIIGNLLRWASVEPHYQASQDKDPNRARALRQDAEDLNEAARNIDRSLGRRDDEETP